MVGGGVRIRRVYEPPASDDGTRVLVDRIWPRGVSKQAAHLDAWIKDVAPSTALRTWYGHDPDKYSQFRDRYRAELAAPANQSAVAQLRQLATGRQLTLLTASRDIEHSHAAVLADVLGGIAVTAPEPDEGGEAACWLPRVCPSCGQLGDSDRPATCGVCGAEILDDDQVDRPITS